MDYTEFQSYREEYLANHDTIIDAGDLNLYNKFPRVETIFPDVSGGHIGNNIHRCHLVEDFLRFYDIETIVDKRHVSFSQGVRQSIAVLMELYKHRQWLIATDNYPYYLKTAKEKGLPWTSIFTLGNDDFDDMLRRESKSDILLMTYPFKPSGETYTDDNWLSLKTWLQKDTARRVILDAVYVFDLKEHAELFSLFHDTGQVIIAYSLSKAFSAPLVAGFTFSLDAEVREVFKQVARNEDTMRLCYLLLNTVEGYQRNQDVRNFLAKQYYLGLSLGLVPMSASSTGYLFYTSGTNPHSHVFVVPASVYDSPSDGYIVSTLSLGEL